MFKNGLKTTSKYHNKKIKTPDGVFDSQRELRDWNSLKEKEAKGEITQLQRQVSFDLIPTIKTIAGTLSKIRYIADFYYYSNNLKQYVVVDSKGFRTDTYNLKKRLFILKYPEILFIEAGKETKIYKEIKNKKVIDNKN